MKLLIATDTWEPQVNGVVRTYQSLKSELESAGHEVALITPHMFRNLPCPTYPEILLAMVRPASIGKIIKQQRPEAIHIATEGPIGWATRRFCLKNNLPFTTSYHTRFPEYVRARVPVPLSLSYKILRHFHKASEGVFVATKSMQKDLELRGIKNSILWTRGVDHQLFHPGPERIFGKEQPVLLYVGRVSVEKNIEAFLTLDLAGKKVVVGDGPARKELEEKFPDCQFTGMLFGEELAKAYRSADLFVFPSLTDTFGLVMIEAMACGVPVAAFPVTGPKDVLTQHINGVMDPCLKSAINGALKLDRHTCYKSAQGFSWESCAQIFLENLALPRTDQTKSGQETQHSLPFKRDKTAA